MQISNTFDSHRMGGRLNPRNQFFQRRTKQFDRDLAHFRLCAFIDYHFQLIFEFRINRLGVETLQGWPMHDQDHINFLRASFGFNVLIDQRHGIIGNIQVFPIHMVNHFGLTRIG